MNSARFSLRTYLIWLAVLVSPGGCHGPRPADATSAASDTGSSELDPSETTEPPDTGDPSTTGLPSESGESSEDEPSGTGGSSDTSDPSTSGDSSGTSDPTPDCDSPLGQTIWEREITGNLPEGHDRFFDIALTGDRVYVVGDGNTETFLDVWTLALDPTSGVTLWESLFNGPENWADEGRVVAVAGSGGPIVGGVRAVLDDRRRNDSPYHSAMWLGGHDEDGMLLWEETIPTQSNDDSSMRDLRVLRDGNFLAAGFAPGAWLRKFAANGDEIWTREYTELPSDIEPTNALSPDEIIEGSDGSIYAVIPNASRNLLVKHTAEGEPVWARYLDTEDDGQGVIGMVMSEAGEIWIAGDKHDDAWVGRFSTEAELLKSYTWGTSGWPDFAVDVAIDTASNIVVVGEYGLESAGAWTTVAFARKLSPDGTVLWEMRTEPTDPAKSYASLRGVATSPDDCSVYATGMRTIAADDEDGMDHVGYVVKFSS